MTMGLLDDLKKQADLVKTQQILQQNLQGDKLKLVEDKMKQTFQYVHELLKQLAVVKPTIPLVYSIPGVADFRNLVFTESFIDYRKKRINDKEYFDTTHLFGLGVEYLSIPAQEVSDEMLEDFAKALIGQQSEIRKYRVAGAPGTFR